MTDEQSTDGEHPLMPPPIDHSAGGALGANVVDTQTRKKNREKKPPKDVYDPDRAAWGNYALTIGDLPKSYLNEMRLSRSYRQKLTAEVMRVHRVEELGVVHEHEVNLATHYHRVGLILNRQFRKKEGEMDMNQYLKYTVEVAEAAKKRNEVVRRLLVVGGETDKQKEAKVWDDNLPGG